MRTPLRGGLVATLSAGAVLTVGGCGSDDPEPLPPPPTRIEAKLVAAADVNPDISGKPAPVVVQLYDLAAETAFSNADFFQLHDDDTAVLGADLIARSEYILLPGETITVSKALPAEARFLGATTAYQAIEAASWRALTLVPANQTTTLTLAVGRLTVTFQDVTSVDPSTPEKKEKKR
jgi:type VI secretion system protein VasD